MKLNRHTKSESPAASIRLILAGSIAALLASHSAQAASATWNASPTNGNWEAAGSENNWSTGAATFPGALSSLTNTDTATFSGVSSTTTISINSTAGNSTPLGIGSITFTGTSPSAYTVGTTGGNSLLLGSGGTISIASATSGTGATETVNAPLVLEPATATTAGAYTFSNASSLTGSILKIGGTVTGGTTSQGITLTLTGASTTANTVSGIISNGGAAGGVSVTKTSSGTWILSGANIYTGATTISAGTLKVGNATALGTGTASVTSGAVLDLNGTTMTVANSSYNALTLNGTGISSGGALTNSSSTAGTYAGLVTLGSTGVQIGGTGSIALSNTGTLYGTSTGFGLTLAGAGGGSIASIINGGTSSAAGAGTLTVNTTGTWTLSGANTYTGATTIGTAGSLTSGGTLTASGTAGTINASSGYTINGTGSKLLLDNTAGNVDRLGNSDVVTLNYGGELSLTGNTTTNSTETIATLALGTGSGIVTVSSAASRVTTLQVTGALTRTNLSTALLRGTSLNQSAATNVSQITLGTAPTGTSFVGTNTLSGGGASDGTQALKIIPWLIGDTTVSGTGTFFVTYDSTLGLRVLNSTEVTTLAAGSTTAASPVNAVAFNGTVTTSGLTVNSLLFNTGTQTFNGSGALTVNSGAVAAVAATELIGSGFSSLALGNGEGVLTATGSNVLTVNTPINVTSSGGLTKSGGGTVVLGASNLYTGQTTVNQGTLQIGTGTAGDLGGNTANIVLNGGTLSFGRTNAGLTIQNTISGIGGVTQSGSGSTTLSGTNTYTGTTTLTAGILILNSTNALPGGIGSTGGTGWLSFNGGALGLGSGDFTRGYNATAGTAATFGTPANQGAWWAAYGSDRIVNVGGASGSQTFFNGKALNFGFATATNMVTLTNPMSNTTVTRLVNVTRGLGSIDGQMSGAGTETAGSLTGLSVSGTGILALTGANSFTGNVVVNSGVTIIANSLASSGSASSIGSGTFGLALAGGTFRYAPVGLSGGAAVSINRNFAISASSTLDTSGTGALVFNQTGNVSPDVSGLAFTSTGTTAMTLTSSNTNLAIGMTVSGPGVTAGTKITGISANVLTLSAAVASGSGSASFGYPTARTLTLTGTNTGANSIAGVLQDSSATGTGVLSLTKAGFGSWTLSGANTYSGATAVNAGNLTLAFGTVASNILPSGSALTLGGGTLQLTGTGTQTLASLATTAGTTSAIVLAANETITLGALGTFGTGSGLNLNTSAGGADASTATVGSSTIVLPAGLFAGNTISSGFTVTDSTGFGLATVDASNNVVRLTAMNILPGGSATLLPASPAPSIDYLVNNNAGGSAADGSSTLAITNTQSVNSVTVDTTAASGVLTLNSGVTLSNNTFNFGGVGSNTYQITGGAGLKSVNSGDTIRINNFNPGVITFATPILANGTNAVNVNGTGTTAFTGANTYTGTTTITGGGTLQFGSTTAIGTGTLVINGGNLDSSVANLVNANNNAQTWNSDFTFVGTQNLNLGTGAVTLGGNRQVTVTANTLTVGGAISGAFGLTTAGAGTLALTGTNTYSGSTTVSAGTLQIGAAGSLGSGTYTGSIYLASGATLEYSSSATQTLSGVISGPGTFTKDTSTSALTLSGTNTYTGVINVNAGTVNLANATTLPGTGTLAIGSGGTVNLPFGSAGGTTPNTTVTGAGVLNLIVSGGTSPSNNFVYKLGGFTGTVNLAGSGRLTLSGPASGFVSPAAGAILNLESGTTLYLGYGSATLGCTVQLYGPNDDGENLGQLRLDNLSSSGPVILMSSSTIGSASGTGTLSGVISDGGLGYGFTSQGSGTLLLNAANTFSGATNFYTTAATLKLGNALALQNSTVNLSKANGLTFGTGIGTFKLGGLAGAQSLSLLDTGSTAVTLQVGNNNASTAYTGALSGTLSNVTKIGTGTLTLSGLNTYTGSTTVNAGMLLLSYATNTTNVLSSSSALVMGGGTLQLNGNSSGTSAQTLASLSLTAGTASSIVLAPNGGTSTTLTITGTTPSSGAQLNFNYSASTTNGPTVGNAIVAWNPAIPTGIIGTGYTVTDTGGTGFATVNGSGQVIRLADPGSAGLPVSIGASTTNYFVNQTYSTSDSTIAGSLIEALSGSTAANTVTLNTTGLASGANLALGANTLTITAAGGIVFAGANPYSITGAGGITSSATGTITFNNYNTGGVTISAPITDTAGTAVTFAGPGTTILSGQSTYTGVTTLGSGIVQVGANETPGTSGPLGNSSASNPGSIVFNGGTLQYSGSNQNDYSGRFSTAANQAFNIDVNGQAVTFASPLASVGGSLTLSSTLPGGTLTLAASNAYTGATTIKGGTLAISFGTLGGTTSALTLGGGTLDLGGSSQTVGAVSITAAAASGNTIQSTGGPGSLTGTSYAASNTTGNAIIAANLLANSSAGFTMSGAGTATLSGANAYTGATTINAGTLNFQGAGALPSSSPVSLGAGTLQISNDGAGSSGTIAVGNNITLSVAGTASTINVGNNGSANTGNTVAFGALSNGTTATAFNSTINLTGTNGYLQSYTSLALSGFTGQNTTLNPTSTSVTITGNVTNQESGTVSAHYDTLTLDGTSTGNAINGVISDNGGYTSVGNGDTRVTKSNSSTWTLNGVNTFHGPISITGGTLQIGGAGQLGAGNYGSTISISSGATLEYSSSANQTLSGVISGTLGALTKDTSSNSTLTLSGANTYSGGTTVSNGTLTLSGFAAEPSTGTLAINSGATVNLNNLGTTSNSPSVSVTGSGALNVIIYSSLNNALKYSMSGFTGAVDIGGNGVSSGGQLLLQSPFVSPASAAKIIVENGTTLYLGYLGSTNLICTVQLNGTTDDGENLGQLRVELNAQQNGPVILNANSTIGSTSGTGYIGGVISDGGHGYGFTKQGSGTLALTNTNTYTGGVTINAGTLQLGSTGALNSTAGSENAVTFGASSTGTLALAGNSVVVAKLSTNATPGTTFVQNANGSGVSNATLTVGNSANQSGTYAGTIQDGTGGGTLGLTKAGNGTLTLTGTNTYAGGTTVSAGALVAGVSNATTVSGAFGPSGNSVTLGDVNTHTNNSSPVVLIGGPFTVSNPITVANQTTSGTYTIGGSTANSSTFSGAITLNQPLTVSQVTGGTVNITGGITSSNTTVTVSGAGNVTIASAVVVGTSGTSGKLLNTSTGTLNINSGTQTYQTLQIAATSGTTNVNTLLDAGTTVNANATTNFTTSQTLNALNIGGTTPLAGPGAAPSFSGGVAVGSVVTPEPGSISLLLVGALGLASRRRRRA